MSRPRPTVTPALVAHDPATGEEKSRWAGEVPDCAAPALMTVADPAVHAYPIVAGNRIIVKDQNAVTSGVLP